MKKFFAVLLAVICLFTMAAVNAAAVKSPTETVKVVSGIKGGGGGGSITPSATYKPGQSPTYYITPDKGYRIKQVWIDGKPMGAISEFTFDSIDSNQTIYVEFEKISNPTTSANTTGTTVPNTGKTSPNTGTQTNYAVIIPSAFGVMVIGTITVAAVAKKNRKKED
jgi:hypothetical protein